MRHLTGLAQFFLLKNRLLWSHEAIGVTVLVLPVPEELADQQKNQVKVWTSFNLGSFQGLYYHRCPEGLKTKQNHALEEKTTHLGDTLGRLLSR